MAAMKIVGATVLRNRHLLVWLRSPLQPHAYLHGGGMGSTRGDGLRFPVKSISCSVITS